MFKSAGYSIWRLIYDTAKRRQFEEFERLYQFFSGLPAPADEQGRVQFFEFTSQGLVPIEPTPYFLCLQSGKKWFNVQQAEIRKSFLTSEWWGFYQYWIDWKENRWILKHLFSWCDICPDWLFKEDINEEDICFINT